MHERRTIFTATERKVIAEVALNICHDGEAVINNFAKVTAQISKRCSNMPNQVLTAQINDREFTLNKEQTEREVIIMKEVVRQARAVLQFFGADSTSELNQHMIDAGKGSLFDPTSEAYKLLQHEIDPDHNCKKAIPPV